jgi:predicted dehydrogenase
VGVVGLGRVSGSHITAYQAAPNAEIVAVCDNDRATAQKVGSSLGARLYDDYQALLADPSVDAVALLLPHELHFSAAKSALEAGKHVCLEKPMAVTEQQCADLIRLADDRGLVLTVTHNTRYAIPYIVAERLLTEGKLGELRLLRICMIGNEVAGYVSTDPRDTWRRSRNGIGAIIDDAVHYFHLVRWMVGDVTRVQAVGRNALKDLGVEDYALVSGELGNGGWFSIEVNLTAEITWQERMELYGSEASIVIDHKHDPPALLYTGWRDTTGTPVEGVPYDPTGWRDASIAESVYDFVAAVTEGRPSRVDLRHAAYAVRLVEKALQSIAADGQPITV